MFLAGKKQLEGCSINISDCSPCSSFPPVARSAQRSLAPVRPVSGAWWAIQNSLCHGLCPGALRFHCGMHSPACPVGKPSEIMGTLLWYLVRVYKLAIWTVVLYKVKRRKTKRYYFFLYQGCRACTNNIQGDQVYNYWLPLADVVLPFR